MEERILDYNTEEDMQNIISNMINKYFLLVKHSPRTKQLYFKKYPTEPETIITSDE